jgi:hypothetical protein
MAILAQKCADSDPTVRSTAASALATAPRGGRTAFEKVGRKLRLPDDFCQSQTGIDNFRPALTKVVRQFEKLAGIPKSRTEIEISSGKPKIPDGNSQSQTAFGEISRLSKKSGDFYKSRATPENVRRNLKFPADFFNFRPTLQKARLLFIFPDNLTGNPSGNLKSRLTFAKGV